MKRSINLQKYQRIYCRQKICYIIFRILTGVLNRQAQTLLESITPF